MPAQRRFWIREPFSGISHLLGAALSVVGLIVLLVAAHGRPWQTVSFAIYGASLVTLYLSSGLYHSLHVDERWLGRLQKLDHMTIFVLIAGSYVPICLVALRGAWGWSLLGIEIALALTGILIVACCRRPASWVRVVLYIAMGWLALVAIGPLRAVLPPSGLVWLLAGGIIYSVGTVIYGSQRPRLWPGAFGAHDLWHVFVLGGSVCHYMLVLRCLT